MGTLVFIFGIYYGVVLASLVLLAALAALYGLGAGVRWFLLWISSMIKKCPEHDREMTLLFNTYECDVCEGRVTQEEVDAQAVPPALRLDHCLSMAREGKHCEFACEDPQALTNTLQTRGLQNITARANHEYLLQYSQGQVVFRPFYGHERGDRHKTSPLYVKRANQVIWLYYES